MIIDRTMRALRRSAAMPTVVLAALIALAGPVAADDTAAHLGARADRVTYDAFLQAIELPRDQRIIAEFLFTDYAAAFEDLVDEVDDAAEAAGRGQVEKAFSGQLFMSPDELRRMRVAVETIYRNAQPEAQTLLNDLVEQTLSLMPPHPAQARALADFRRALVLAPRRSLDSDEVYAGDGVDLVAVVAEARADGGELAAVPADRLALVLARYVDAMDQHLREGAAAEQADRVRETIARIERSENERRAAEASRVERWRAFRSITDAGASGIAALAEELSGAEARVRWERRMRRASFPWLMATTLPEQQHEWIRGHVRSETALATATTILESYRQDLEPLAAEAIALIVKARVETGVMLHARVEIARLPAQARAIHQELLRNSGARAQLAAKASAEMDALLSDGQRAQLRADLAARAYGRR